jgi:mono/diheme cytochrome c family protein
MVGLAVSGLALGSLAGQLTGRAAAQGTVPGAGSPPPAKTPAAPHVHATPKGWRFTWPKGDPAKGRDVFQKLECYSCHEVRGERFPAPSDSERTGPELSMMGPLHPPEFFAESIINPSAVVERGRGYGAADGSSKMPSYGDSLTVQETIDLVAYLRQLRPPAASSSGAGGHAGHPSHTTP